MYQVRWKKLTAYLVHTCALQHIHHKNEKDRIIGRKLLSSHERVGNSLMSGLHYCHKRQAKTKPQVYAQVPMASADGEISSPLRWPFPYSLPLFAQHRQLMDVRRGVSKERWLIWDTWATVVTELIKFWRTGCTDIHLELTLARRCWSFCRSSTRPVKLNWEAIFRCRRLLQANSAKQ